MDSGANNEVVAHAASPNNGSESCRVDVLDSLNNRAYWRSGSRYVQSGQEEVSIVAAGKVHNEN
jgi:hypothetical protein